MHAQLRELDSRGLNASIQPRTYTIEDSSGTSPLGDWRRLLQAMVVLSRERTFTVGDYSDYDCMETEGGTPSQSGRLFGLFPRSDAPVLVIRKCGNQATVYFDPGKEDEHASQGSAWVEDEKSETEAEIEEEVEKPRAKVPRIS